MTLELFHQIAHPASAQVRRYIVEKHLDVRFRNVVYEEVVAALKAYGGSGEVPSLWDGDRLHEGSAAVLARLASAAPSP